MTDPAPSPSTLVRRVCAHCGARHVALRFAPRTAPCLDCARAPAVQLHLVPLTPDPPARKDPTP